MRRPKLKAFGRSVSLLLYTSLFPSPIYISFLLYFSVLFPFILSMSSDSRSSASSPPSSSSSSSSSSAASGSVALDYYKREFAKFADTLDRELGRYPTVQILASKVNIRSSTLVLSLFVFLFGFLFFGIGANFVANLVGFCYPLYDSFRALSAYESNSPDREAHLTELLTYWVVYCSFTLVESATDFLSLWIPLYHLVKIAFLVYCFAPQTRGSLVIYQRIIEPILNKYEGKIDRAGGRFSAFTQRVESEIRGGAKDGMEGEIKNLADQAVKNLVNSASNAANSAAAGSIAGEASAAEGSKKFT